MENRKSLPHAPPSDHVSAIGRVCVPCVKVFSLALLFLVAIVGVTYSIIMIKSNKPEGGRDASIYVIQPKIQPTTGSQHLNTNSPRTMLPTRKKLHFQFKELYVLSHLRNINGSSQTPIPSHFNSSNSFNELPNYDASSHGSIMYTVGMSTANLCATSVIDFEGSFNCTKLVPSRDNIFFLETSCAVNQIFGTPDNTTMALSEKQACSIYSAAHHNPSRKVILLFTCPVQKTFNWTMQWRILFDLPNFFFSRVDVEDLYANTALSEFYYGPLSLSKYPVAHQADLLRMFILYLYGGTYMDMDVISFLSLDGLGYNYIISQGKDIMYNAVIISFGVWNFEPNHRFLEESMIDGMLHYNPNIWATIGPDLFTNTLKHLCNISGPLESIVSTELPVCKIRVLPHTTFFCIPWWEFYLFYESDTFPEVEKRTNGSYGVHYWNSRGGQYTLVIGSDQPAIKFAEQQCQSVCYHAGKTLS